MERLNDLSSLFSSMGKNILSSWRELFFKESCFPELAFDSLIENELYTKIDQQSLTHWIMSANELPQQQYLNSKFGDYRLTVYSCDRFFIEILYWLDGTTSIHQHSFSGAFSIIKGSSIHSIYEFNQNEEINQTLLFGDVSFKSIEKLVQGDIRKISSQATTAHSLFHLGVPSISIVIRTYRDSTASQQLNFLKPNIALDPFASNIILKRQNELLTNLVQTDLNYFLNFFLTSISSLDLHSHIMLILNHAFELQKYKQLEKVIEHFSLRAEKLAAELLKTTKIICLNRVIMSMRQKLQSEDLRFFLAVLLNSPNRIHSRNLIAQAYPEKNIDDLIFKWLEALVESADINEESISEESLPFIMYLVKGYTFEKIINQLNEIYDVDQVTKNIETFKNLYDHFIEHSILSSLLK